MKDVVDRLRETSDDERRRHVVEVLEREFSEAAAESPGQFRLRFRKMARGPWDFYRGSACLFYDDVARAEDPFVDERTSRVWIQGDLHGENFGTYMNSRGRLVLDVNDFDEAYLGHWTWDLARLAASVVVLGVGKAFSDDDLRGCVDAYVRAYGRQVRDFVAGNDDQEFALKLDGATGAVRDVLRKARTSTRVDQLRERTAVDGVQRRLLDVEGSTRHLDDEEHARVIEAYERYLETIPERKRRTEVAYELKDVVSAWGFGVDSVGLRSYNLLVEGQTEALENDVVLTVKQGQRPALQRVVEDPRLDEAFVHQGHRTVVSRRALQNHTDPWAGHCELDGGGWAVTELSPYDHDLEWDDVDEPDQAVDVLRQLGRATAKIHCVGDQASEQSLVDFSVEHAVAEVCDGGDGEDQLVDALTTFALAYGQQVRDDHRLFVDAFRSGEVADL